MEIDKRIVAKEALIAEIEGWKKNPPEGYSWTIEFNNFHTYLPNDNYLERGGSCNTAYMAEIAGLMDQTFKSFTSNHRIENNIHSHIYLTQTPREFLKHIEDTIEELPEISLEIIKDMQDKHHKTLESIDWKEWNNTYGTPEHEIEDKKTQRIHCLFK